MSVVSPAAMNFFFFLILLCRLPFDLASPSKKKNFPIRVSEQELLFYGSLAKDKPMSGKCFQTILI